MQSTFIRRTILATVGATAASLAMAHVGADGASHAHDLSPLQSFTAGALHPLTGLDHLAAMVSVGAWSALSFRRAPGQPVGWRALLAAPAAFAATLLVGALLGMGGLSLPGVEPMIAASLLVLGLLVATRMQLGAATGAALVAMFALFHGIAHGAELGGHAVPVLLGMVGSTAVLHGVGLALGLRMRGTGTGPQRWAPRLLGGGVALMGLGMLTPAIAAIV